MAGPNQNKVMELQAICARPPAGFTKTSMDKFADDKFEAAGYCSYMKFIMRMMKLTSIFILAACLSVSAGGWGQQVTLSVKNVPLGNVLKTIKKQTGYQFLYNDELMRKTQPVTIELKKVPVTEALNRLLLNQPLHYRVVDKTIVLKPKNEPEPTNVLAIPAIEIPEPPPSPPLKIRVVDSLGKPLAGATVTIKGKKTWGTATNANGEYTLDVKEGDVLEVSYVGYESQNVNVTTAMLNEQQFIVRLKMKNEELDDLGVVVNTGYQQLPKERGTGSFSFVDSSMLSKQVTTDIFSRLEAVSNSLTVDRTTLQSSGNIQIRGLSTVYGPRDPLVVVDNFPYYGDLSAINPNDIQDITILKDAAAASIWGSRAGNGVLVITTKKAKTNQPVSLSFTTNMTTIAKPDIYYLPWISPSDAVEAETILFKNGYRFSDTVGNYRRPFTPVYELLFRQQKGLIIAERVRDSLGILGSHDVREDFNKYVYKTALNQQYALSLTGGAGGFSWLMFVGYDKNLNQLSASYDRKNMRWSSTFRPDKRLTFNVGFAYTQSATQSGKYGIDDIYVYPGKLYSYARLASADGSPAALNRDYRALYTDTVGGGMLLDWKYYPLEDYRYQRKTSMMKNVVANLSGEYKISPSFSVTGSYQLQQQDDEQQAKYIEDSYFARDLINLFSQLNYSTRQVTRMIPLGEIWDRGYARLVSHQYRGQLSFNKSVGIASIYAIAGSEVREYQNKNNGYRQYGVNTSNLSFSQVDYVNTYPTLVPGSNRLIPQNAYLNDKTQRFVSTFANASVTIAQKYSVSLSARTDASNIYGVKTNDKWNPFWSAGLGWVITDKRNNTSGLMEYLKLRTTFGYNGNADPNRAAVTTISYSGRSTYTQSPYAVFANYANPELKWERAAQLNIGVDFSIFSKRIRGSLEHYRKYNSDLIAGVAVDYTSGVSFVNKNYYDMNGVGWDLELNSVNIMSAFKWSTKLNLSYYTDRAKNFGGTAADNGVGFIAYGSPIGMDGKPVYGLYAFRWAGLDPDTGDPQGYLNNEVSKDYNAIFENTRVEDLVYMGSAIPTFFGNLDNTISYRGLSLSLGLLFKFGYYFQKESISYSNLIISGSGHKDYANRWQQKGDELFTDVPSFIYPYNALRDEFYAKSDVNMVKGDHIRLQYITMSYDLSHLLSRKFLKSMQFYGSASDIGVLWRANKFSIDPDYRSNMPNPTRLSIGLKATL